MTTTPLVSVVTPTFNPGERLERCLENVASQNYEAIEHIVVDGGSTDGTLDLLRSRPDIRFVSEPDEGQADAINKGFELASGDIVGWLNADDVLTEDAVHRTVHAIERDGVGWTIGDVVVVSNGRAQLERPARPERPQTWRARNVAAQPGSFVTRWALDEVGFLDPSFHYMMDLDLWIRLIDAEIKHAYIPEVLAAFEVHPDSKSGSVPHSHFLVDDARARFKSGRLNDASFAFGRAMAWGLEASPHRTEVAAELSSLFGAQHDQLRSAEIARGLRTEQTILSMKRGDVRGVSRLVDPRLWMHGSARSRMIHVIGRFLSQSKRRAAAQEASSLLAYEG